MELFNSFNTEIEKMYNTPIFCKICDKEIYDPDEYQICEICNEEYCLDHIDTNYKSSGWNVCCLGDCQKQADREIFMSQLDGMNDDKLDELITSKKVVDGLIEAIRKENELLEKVARKVSDDNRTAFECGCYYNGMMRHEDCVLLLYTNAADTRTTFSVGLEQNFVEAYNEAMRHWNRPLVKVGQGDNQKKWTPELINEENAGWRIWKRVGLIIRRLQVRILSPLN